MRSPFPSSRSRGARPARRPTPADPSHDSVPGAAGGRSVRGTRLRGACVLAATACQALVACGGQSAPTSVAAAPDQVIAGPQGGRGQFAVECGFDRFLADDPIVFPGRPGASHLHQFFGAHGVTATSNHDQLMAGTTTCEQPADTASYWAPVLLDAEHQPVEPLGAVAYYRAGVDVDPAAVESYPAGLMLVAGDHTAVEPQPLSVVAWTCDSGALRDVTPPDCRGATNLRLLITFQDCWDGEHLRSDDPARPGAHAAYSIGGECPESHPVHIPQLQFAVDFPPLDPAGLALSSGGILSGHADFWNAWHQDKLEREVDVCLRRDLPCKISGRRTTIG